MNKQEMLDVLKDAELARGRYLYYCDEDIVEADDLRAYFKYRDYKEKDDRLQR